MSRVRVFDIVGSVRAPSNPQIRVFDLAGKAGSLSGPQIRVFDMVARSRVLGPQVRIFDIAGKTRTSDVPTAFRRAHGGDWEPGWFMRGNLFKRVHPDAEWLPTTRPGIAPEPGEVPTPTPTPSPQWSTKKVALIGDSTLNGIGETAMRNALVARGFTASNIWFYARSGKPIILNDDLGKNALVNMAEARAALGGEPDMWLFNLGSNGHRDARNPEWIGQVLANAGSAEVIWSGITQANGYTDGNLSSEATRLAWNDVARPIIEAHPTGRWLDWHGYAMPFAGGDIGWWNADGVHHTALGTAKKLEFLANALATTPPPTAASGAHVIVGLIQSNIRGAATDYIASDQYDNPLIEMYRWSDGKLVPATEPMSTRDSGVGMGAMNTFVKRYAAANPGQRIVVINTARGGTGLTTPSTNTQGTAFTWDPNAANDANNLARSSVTAINSLMAALPSGSKIVAFLANHGSTDGSNGTPKATFKTLMTNWLTFLRTQTNTPTVPYLMMQMRPSLLVENRHNLIDQGQQEIAAETPNVEHIPAPVGTEYAKDDSVHFNARGVREIGVRMYERFATLATPTPTPEQTPSVPAGALPLGTASYPIVGEARYLATNGNNANAGTQAAPWATLQHAINNTPSGGTIVVRGGVHYGGSYTSPNGKTLRIINAPGETVWFDGTVEVTGWTSNGNNTWTAPYAYTFIRADVETSYKGTNPMRNHPDQLWLDTTAMVQVSDNTVPGAGQFSVNQATDTITVGTNPSGKVARAVAHKQFIVASGRTDLLGIGVRRYSPETMEFLNAMIYMGGSNDGAIVENCHFRESHLAALHITRPNMRVSRNTIENGGQTGVHAYQAHNLVFEQNYIHHINRMSWQPEPTTAAAKFTMANFVVVRHNVVHDVNGAYGLWFDVSMNRFKIYGNETSAGAEVMKHGIEVELSGGGYFNSTQHTSYIVGNKTENCKVGILVFDSSDVVVSNNDMRGSEVGLQIWQDKRFNEGPLHGQTYTFEELPWIARNNKALNNVYRPGGGYNLQLVAYDDGGVQNLLGLEMVTLIAGEWFYPAPPGSAVQLGRLGGARTSYNTPTALAGAGADVGGPIGSKLGAVGQSSAYPNTAQMQATAYPASAVVAEMLNVPVGTRLIGPNVANLPVTS